MAENNLATLGILAVVGAVAVLVLPRILGGKEETSGGGGSTTNINVAPPPSSGGGGGGGGSLNTDALWALINGNKVPNVTAVPDPKTGAVAYLNQYGNTLASDTASDRVNALTVALVASGKASDLISRITIDPRAKYPDTPKNQGTVSNWLTSGGTRVYGGANSDDPYGAALTLARYRERGWA